MADGEDDVPTTQETGGPKIKMGRLGKRGKKEAPGKKDDSSAATKAAPLAKMPTAAGSGPTGGFTEKDIEFMKKAIQVLCQSTNPLGRSIEFVSDDLDSMNKEYEHWRKES